MTTKQTCEGRIDEGLANRITEFEDALKGKYPGNKKYEDFIDWLNQFALAYSDDPHYRAKRLELSCGGPQDFFLFYENGDIEYRFLDWFDGAVRLLDGHYRDVMNQVYEYLKN